MNIPLIIIAAFICMGFGAKLASNCELAEKITYMIGAAIELQLIYWAVVIGL